MTLLAMILSLASRLDGSAVAESGLATRHGGIRGRSKNSRSKK